MNSYELNNKVFKMIQISSHENLLLKTIDKFYENLDANYYEDFFQILNSHNKDQIKTKISIRLIDYFVTKYSKKYKISIKINNDLNTQFPVHQSYKQQLKAFQKKSFDPFARGLKIPYFINNDCIITTIGQLNFFMWFISKNIMDYVIKNKQIIELDMNKNKKIKLMPKIKKKYKISKKYDIKPQFPIITNNKITENNENNENIKNKTIITVTF
jgi:hypothetical protein